MKKERNIIGHGDFQYQVHQNWGNLDSSKYPILNAHEMVMDNSGRLIMVGDHPKNNVLIYDRSGKLLDYWDTPFEKGHGITHWDANGEEFLFITETSKSGEFKDAGRVSKTDIDGNVLMVIEHPYNYGEMEKDGFWSPTQSTVGPTGDIYVADGYGSCYIFQFSEKGEFIRKFGGRGNGKDQFQTAHGICVDYRSSSDDPTLLITSRAHNCFKRFTLDGRYIETIHLPNAFVCRPVIKDDILYSGVCWSSDVTFDENDMENTHPAFINKESGFVTILDKTDKVVSNPGGTEPNYKDGHLLPLVQDDPATFKHCHDVCVDDDLNLYICQWKANGAYPIKLERV